MVEKKSYLEWKTSVLGVLTLVFGVLLAFGIITPEQQQGLSEGVSQLGEQIGGIIVAISGVINIFRAK